MQPRRFCICHTACPSCVLTASPGLTGLSRTVYNHFSPTRYTQLNAAYIPDTRLLPTWPSIGNISLAPTVCSAGICTKHPYALNKKNTITNKPLMNIQTYDPLPFSFINCTIYKITTKPAYRPPNKSRVRLLPVYIPIISLWIISFAMFSCDLIISILNKLIQKLNHLIFYDVCHYV